MRIWFIGKNAAFASINKLQDNLTDTFPSYFGIGHNSRFKYSHALARSRLSISSTES